MERDRALYDTELNDKYNKEDNDIEDKNQRRKSRRV